MCGFLISPKRLPGCDSFRWIAKFGSSLSRKCQFYLSFCFTNPQLIVRHSILLPSCQWSASSLSNKLKCPPTSMMKCLWNVRLHLIWKSNWLINERAELPPPLQSHLGRWSLIRSECAFRRPDKRTADRVHQLWGTLSNRGTCLRLSLGISKVPVHWRKFKDNCSIWNCLIIRVRLVKTRGEPSRPVIHWP